MLERGEKMCQCQRYSSFWRVLNFNGKSDWVVGLYEITESNQIDVLDDKCGGGSMIFLMVVTCKVIC